MDTQPCTILRIKRKRHEEPLEGLVIERKKKAGGVFTFAQTVEAKAWNDEMMKEQLQVRCDTIALYSVLQTDTLQKDFLHLANIATGPSSPPRIPLPKRRRTETKNDARRYIVKDPTSQPESPIVDLYAPFPCV